MNAYRVSAHLVAANEYLALAARHAGHDPIADTIRQVIATLHSIDPDFHEDVPGPQPQVPALPPKPSRASTIRLLVQLRKENPDATNARLGEMLADRGHISRSGGTLSGQSVYLLLKRSQSDTNKDDSDDDTGTAWSWRDVA